MADDIQIIIGLLSAALFAVGLMARQKVLPYALAVLALLTLLAGRSMFPASITANRPDITTAPAKAEHRVDAPSKSSQHEDGTSEFLSLTTQTSACSSAAGATVTKAASGKGQPKDALDDAKAAATTCREAAAVIGNHSGAADYIIAQAARSCLEAVTARAVAMDHLASLLDGMSTLEDTERYKVQQSEALLKEFSCQTALQPLSPPSPINIGKSKGPSPS